MLVWVVQKTRKELELCRYLTVLKSFVMSGFANARVFCVLHLVRLLHWTRSWYFVQLAFARFISIYRTVLQWLWMNYHCRDPGTPSPHTWDRKRPELHRIRIQVSIQTPMMPNVDFDFTQVFWKYMAESTWIHLGHKSHRRQRRDILTILTQNINGLVDIVWEIDNKQQEVFFLAGWNRRSDKPSLIV